MTLTTLRQLRLQNQHISVYSLTLPGEIVSHMLAMQAQVYPMAKWAIGLRLPRPDDKEIDNAFNSGRILRTHVLRPTWHFVSPADIRWLLKLTGPRVQAFNQHYYARQELDKKIFKKCNDILIKSLEGDRQLTRTVLQAALKKSKIKAAGIRLAFIMMQAELDGIICSGRQEGKQFTYALLEERVPASNEIDRDESLFLLAQKYFKSRGPATVNDFAWWSGLTVKDCSNAIAMVKDKLTSEIINGKEFHYVPSPVLKSNLKQHTFIMPDYDEYAIAYKDRSAIFENEKISEKSLASLGYPHVFVVDGVISGTWKMTRHGRENGETEIHASPDVFKTHGDAIDKARKRFCKFTGLKI